MTDDNTELLAPRANPELKGHEEAEALFLRAVASGRLPHGWLITGPRGIGKATLAFRFARHLLREAPSDSLGLFAGTGDDQAAQSLWMSPDDPIFRRVAAEGHPDLVTITRRPDTKGRLPEVIKVEEVRKASAFLRLTPAEAKWRVIVLDAADELNGSAANALLKALEEPPENAILFLVSHQPDRLLPTIRSRCCRLALAPLDSATLDAILSQRLPERSAQDRVLLRHLASGSLGEALRLSSDGGDELFRAAVGLLDTFPKLDGTALHSMADRLGRGADITPFRTTMSLLQWWFGRLARCLANGPETASSETDELWAGERTLVARLGAARPLDHWIKAWRHIGALADATATSHLDRRQAVLTAFLALETSPTWE